MLWQSIGLQKSLPHSAWCSWEGWVAPSSILRFPPAVWQLHNSLSQMQLTLRMVLVMQGLPGAVKSFPPVALTDTDFCGFSRGHSGTRQATAMAKNHMYQDKIPGFDRWSAKTRLITTWVQQSCCQLSYKGFSNRTQKWSFFTVWSFVMITLKGLRM